MFRKFKLAIITVVAIFSTNLIFSAEYILKNVNYIDVKNLTVLKDQTIIVKGDKITSIKPTKKFRKKKGMVVIDMKGKFVIPGLIDTHVHHATSPDDWDNDKVTRMRLRNLLKGGVTAVRDMGGDNRVLTYMKRRADNDLIQSPDIYFSVIIGGQEFFSDPRTVASAKGEIPGQVDWMRAINDSTDLDEVMLRAKGTGATGIKIYAKVPAALMGKLATAAKKHGLKAWSHVYVGDARPIDAVMGGVETISHAPDISSEVVDKFYQLRRKKEMISDEQKMASFEAERFNKLFAEMKTQGTILDPTLAVFEARAKSNEISTLINDWGIFYTKLAHNKGIKISTGTDGTSDHAGVDYPLVQKEMQLLVEHAGLTPLEAIQAATIHGAEVIGIEQETGSIEEGKKANLVILNADPSNDIQAAMDISHVIKNGAFVYRGDDPKLPFTSARVSKGMLWMSGQIGNHPGTMTLVSDDVEEQMSQSMENIGYVLQEHNLAYDDIVKCTLMLANIDDWKKVSDTYKTFFNKLPARSAFATTGLALNAKLEIECVAEL